MADLKPTLWRTCRVLANHARWRVLVVVLERRRLCVSDVAAMCRIRPNKAGEHLRALQARGLLRAERASRTVQYLPVADPLVQHAPVLLAGLRRANRAGITAQEVARAVTAFTHPRRLAIVHTLARTPLCPRPLAAACGMSERAAFRHLNKLCRRRVLCHDQANRYRLAAPSSPLAGVLLRIAIANT